MSVPGLPVEIFQIIFEQLRYRQSALLPLLTICRSLHSEVERLLYRTVELSDESWVAHTNFFSRVISCPPLARHVHRLTLWIGNNQETEVLQLPGFFPYFQLAQALKLTDNLKIFIIESYPYNCAPFLLAQILDNTHFNFSLRVFREKTEHVWWGADHMLAEYPTSSFKPNEVLVNECTGNFIRQQTEIEELQWGYPDVFSSSPMAIPRLRILHTSLECLEIVAQGRPITHLGIGFGISRELRSSTICLPELEVLFVDRRLGVLGPRVSEAFPRLRVLEGRGDMAQENYLLNHLGGLTNLSRLKLIWFALSAIAENVLDTLLGKLFACNPSLQMIEFRELPLATGFENDPGVNELRNEVGSHEVICCTRGMLFQNGLRETRMDDDWKRA